MPQALQDMIIDLIKCGLVMTVPSSESGNTPGALAAWQGDSAQVRRNSCDGNKGVILQKQRRRQWEHQLQCFPRQSLSSFYFCIVHRCMCPTWKSDNV